MKNENADGLRGFAALNVATSHFVAAFFPAMLHGNYPAIFAANPAPSVFFRLLTAPPLTLLYNGHFPVLTFFVLSGYVLALPYFREAADGRAVLQKRLYGRYFRLNLPIIAAVAVSFAAYRSGLYVNLQAGALSSSLSWLRSYFPDGLTFARAAKEALGDAIVFGASDFIPPLWTLRYEFIGSIYLLLFYLVKPRQGMVLPAMLALLLICFFHNTTSIYFLAIFAGSFLGAFRLSPNRFIVGVLFFLGLYFGAFQFESPCYNFLPAIKGFNVTLWEKKSFYNTVGAVLLTAAVVNGFGRRVFSSAISRFLGRVSYSFYLLHYVVLCSLASWLYLRHQTGPWLALSYLIYLTVCLLLAQAFALLVDRPSIRLSHKFSSCLYARIRRSAASPAQAVATSSRQPD